MTEPTDSTTTSYCPGCGAAHVVVGLDSVLLGTRPAVRRHACNVGRVTITDQHTEPTTYDDLFDAAAAASNAADATGVSHHVRKERATGLLVVQPTSPVDGDRFLTVWGPAEPSERARAIYALTHDEDGEYTGDHRVPCSRWGATGAECAAVAYDLDVIVSGETGRGPDAETLEYAMGLVVNDHDDVTTILREHGSAEIRERYAEQLGTDPALLAHARYLGADAALSSVVDHYLMSESDARSILDDVDPEVLDRYPGPTLTDGLHDADSVITLAVDVTGHLQPAEVRDGLRDAWEDGRDAVWSDALQATALRVLGDVQSALELERDIENRIEALRIKSERAAHLS